jgi:thiamine biosynthesis protein ThiI
MMDIAGRVAQRLKAGAVVTGESLGQVASQTLEGLAASDDACGSLVLRPLVGMDKEEIVVIARKIGTLDTSILPYEDCCTVFTPRHPVTKPKLEAVLQAESALDRESLIEEALSNILR